jgi:hypothetical protein
MTDPFVRPLCRAFGAGQGGGRGRWMDVGWTAKLFASTSQISIHISKAYVWTNNWMEPWTGTGWTRPPLTAR